MVKATQLKPHADSINASLIGLLKAIDIYISVMTFSFQFVCSPSFEVSAVKEISGNTIS